MAHLGGLASLYAHLAKWFPTIPIINLISYLLIGISICILSTIYIKTASRNILTGAILIAVLCIENIVFLNATRRAFLFCSVSSVLFFYILKNRKPVLSLIGFLILLFWLLGLFTRVEPALFSLSILGLVLFLPILFKQTRIKPSKYLIFPLFFIISTLLVSVWVTWKINTSQDFYLQIEPECEYEIMVKQNMVPSQFTSIQDSLRYTAIKKGFWNDAKLNDANYIKSLIGQKRKGIFTSQNLEFYNTRFTYILDTSKEHILFSGFLLFIFIFNFRYDKRKILIGGITFLLLILLLILFISFQLKAQDYINNSILFSAITFYWIVLQMYLPHSKTNKEFINIVYIAMVLFLFNLYNNQSIPYKESQKIGKEFINSDNFRNNKTLLLSGEYIENILGANNPLEHFKVFQKKDVYIIDALAITQIQPYKAYLEHTLDCNVADYPSFFRALNRHDPKALYLINGDRINFIKEYLKKVHGYDLGEVKHIALPLAD
ncbi:MAG: hypothetical protein M9888_06115 [Chitinophagales bacterium]|nr:hypothetical protein [Chitinophagales bacterium]